MGPDEVATFRIHEQSCIDYIAAFFLAQRLQGEPVRAMWFEHVLGNHGFTTTNDFMVGVAAVCKRFEVLVIVDETSASRR